MKRTTVKLPEELDARLRHEAARRGMTISELTREAIEAHLGGTRRSFRSTGAGTSEHGHLSSRIDELLAEDLGRPR